MSDPIINETLVNNILDLLKYGLVKGLGVQEPGKMCVEAVVCAAMNLPHSDNPPCVGSAVRAFKIHLNDSNWNSNAARAVGMKRLAIAQLGSKEIDQVEFVKLLIARLKEQKLSSADTADAADTADTDAAYAANAVAYAANAVAYAADAAYAYAAYAYADAVAYAYADAVAIRDNHLTKAAEVAVQILIELGSEGSKFLHLCDVTVA